MNFGIVFLVVVAVVTVSQIILMSIRQERFRQEIDDRLREIEKKLG